MSQKFSDLSDAERIIIVRDRFMNNLTSTLEKPDSLIKLVSEEEYKQVTDFLPSVRKSKANGDTEDCTCGACIALSKIQPRIPKELSPLIRLSRSQCESELY